LIDSGLPRPTTQIPVHEHFRLIALLDMGWETYKVAVEYDGDHHRTNRKQYAKDHWRTRKLDTMGWIVIRVIAEDSPGDTVRRVRAALQRRGWRDT
jgi:very-short-patch-repair endonuclease